MYLPSEPVANNVGRRQFLISTLRTALSFMLYTLVCFHVSCGLAADPVKPVGEQSLDPLGVAWVSDVHLNPAYLAIGDPKKGCEEIGLPGSIPSDSVLAMETDPTVGRAGCSTSPRLLDLSLSFLQGLVECSNSHVEAGDHPLDSDEHSQAIKAAFHSHPLPPIKTVLFTGDFVHSTKSTEEEIVKNSIADIAHAILERFPQTSLSEQQQPGIGPKASHGIQLLVVMGNHDITIKSMSQPYHKEWAEMLYKIWQPALPDDSRTRETFIRGLYYSATLRAAPSVRVLCLNTNVYFKKLRLAARNLREKSASAQESTGSISGLANNPFDDEDPVGQFAWFEEELSSARSLGQRVLIAGHIFPGVTARLGDSLIIRNNWDEPYISRYRDLIAAYSDIIIAQLYGHEHDGQVRVLLPSDISAIEASARAGPGCAPLKPNAPTAILTCPSISPADGTNPAMRVLLLEALKVNDRSREVGGVHTDDDSSTAAFILSDYVQYHLPLYGFVKLSGSGGVAPVFEFEHSFQDTFRPTMRCAKPPQPREREEFLPDFAHGSAYCIDGSTALRLAEAVRCSPHAYSLYQHFRHAGGSAVSSAVVSCSTMSVTDKEALDCIR